jgi:hypothetical protein
LLAADDDQRDRRLQQGHEVRYCESGCVCQAKRISVAVRSLMPSIDFTHYIVYSRVPRLGGSGIGPVVSIECHVGNNLASCVFEFYQAQIFGPPAEDVGGIFFLRYPITRYHEIYQLLRDGARSVHVNPPEGILVVSSLPGDDLDRRWRDHLSREQPPE